MSERDYVVCRLDGGWPGVWIGAQEAAFLSYCVKRAGNGSPEADSLSDYLLSCWTDKPDETPLYVKASDG